jgi:hypothetical protein
MIFLRALCILAGLTLAFALEVQAADQAHALRAGRGGVIFHYAVMPAEIVLGPTNRAMHDGGRQGTSHVVVAVFDALTNERIATTEVTASVSRAGSAPVIKRLQPMAIADLPVFGGFFELDAPGVYTLRFKAIRPGATGAAAAAEAEFEYRVSPERRR